MISVKQNDRRPAAAATLKHGTTIVPLSLATSVTFTMTPLNDTEKKIDAAAAVVTDAAAGEVEYRWAVGDTDTAGEFLAEWEVIWSDGTNETFPTIDFDRVNVYTSLD